ncbi:hypothetical protein RMCBS344292_06906 [Rhizopus microsporus]|nr:hypothetical protein RMCBS344292_06906 [Rhizopus microsporus]
MSAEPSPQIKEFKKKKPLPKIPMDQQSQIDLFQDALVTIYCEQQLWVNEGWKISYCNPGFPQRVEKPFEPLPMRHKQSKEQIEPDLTLPPLDHSTPDSPASFVPAQLFSVSENYFQPSPVSSGVPSPWSTSTTKRSVVKRQSISRISTCSVLAALPVTITQTPDEASDMQQDNSIIKDDVYYKEIMNKHAGSIIASCSLVQVRSNIKLYRRMALKTRNRETQMAYARYLLRIVKLYPKSSSSDEAADTRHRLLSETGYWIERLAKKGQPEALFVKGKWHLLGPQADDCAIKGYEKVNEKKAFKCFRLASKAGWVDAYYELAHLYKKRGKYEKAIIYYEKGAKEYHTLSIYKMAKIYLRGQLKRPADIEKGIQYLKIAANVDGEVSAEPAFVLGCIYADELERIGVQGDSSITTNYSQALEYIKKSANYGYPDAVYLMGQISEIGMLGQQSDAWTAYQHYLKAAEANHTGAMLDLSRMYLEGIPGLLASQKTIAFKWCKRSAELGFAQAEYVLGKYYEDGIGISPDYPRALEYFGRAASKGYHLAAKKLNKRNFCSDY